MEEKKYNIITPSREKSIFDPGSEFIKELELYKIKSEIKPRKVDMMKSQVGMMVDMVKEKDKKKIYIPGKSGFL